MVISLTLCCVQVLQPRVQIQGILNGDLPQASENMFRPWDVYSNYHPEFRKISRVRHLKDIIIFLLHILLVFKIIILFH